MNRILFPALAIFVLLAACTKGEPPAASRPALVGQAKPAAGCQGCHPLAVDAAHDLPCADCHGGDAKAVDQAAAHAGLVGQVAHPDRLAETCGRCHRSLVDQAAASLHFTLAKEVNLVRQAFGATASLASLTEVPVSGPPTSALSLADDLLRRRCLDCHLYSKGGDYPATRHGTGCAACHLAYDKGRLTEHRFRRQPTDRQCLACHYGNRVGSDYYGRFEHDYQVDFETPFQLATADDSYGVRFHQLRPDVHQQAGLACIDCHGAEELMAGARPVTCLDCHGPQLRTDTGLGLSEGRDGERWLRTRVGGRRLAVPRMQDPAHQAYGATVGCQVCHAQWSFADHGNHLLRLDRADYEPWESVSRQGDRQVELLLRGALARNGQDEVEPSMADRLSGRLSAGVWLQAYELRRWEEVNICPDPQGRLQVCRPLLDLHLSYVDAEGEVVIDGAVPSLGPAGGLLPYTPHTTGRAGAFYRQRLLGRVEP